MRTVLLFILIAVLVIGGIFFFAANTTTTEQIQEEDPTETSGNQNQNINYEDFKATLLDSVRVSLRYPSDTTVTQVNDSVIEIKYIGPGSEPATEITDGYYASVELVESSNINSYAEAQAESDTEPLTFNGQTALTYSTVSVLNDKEITHVVYQPADTSNLIIDISYSIQATSSALETKYQSELLDTLSSLLVVSVSDVGLNQETVMLAMLDYDGIGEESEGFERGCDRVVMVEQTIPATTIPLNASLDLLFNLESETVSGWNNFIATVNDTLSFDRATLENGTANIYLTGELTGLGGVCDNPRARIQIEETALQFDTVSDVKLYLNGSSTDLQPSGA